MSEKNIVIENKEVSENIVRRLENNKESIYILDTTDNSKIVMSEELINILKAFYKCKSKWGASINDKNINNKI